MSTRNEIIDECIAVVRDLPEGTWGDVRGEASPWPEAIKVLESIKDPTTKQHKKGPVRARKAKV